jgi:hypothetical protein
MSRLKVWAERHGLIEQVAFCKRRGAWFYRIAGPIGIYYLSGQRSYLGVYWSANLRWWMQNLRSAWRMGGILFILGYPSTADGWSFRITKPVWMAFERR